MSDPQDQTPDVPAAEPSVDSTEPAAGTEAAPTRPVTGGPATATAQTDGPTVVPVQRRFLIAGSIVGAVAVIALAFGAGYLVGDHTGDSSTDRDGPRMSQFEDRFGQDGPMPGMGQFPGMSEEAPGRGGEQNAPGDDGQTDQSTAPTAPTEPSAVPG